MKDVFVGPESPLRKLFPLVRKLRYWAWKFHSRAAMRLVINGGKIKFMDAELEFPEQVGLLYSTPLFWEGPEAYEGPSSRTIALLASRSKLFLDIGSNIGIYSVYVGVAFPQVKTFAFEPVPAIWKKNRRFHQLNRLPENTVHNLALGDRNGRVDLFLPVYDTALEEEQTATLCRDSWQTHEEKFEKIEIECTTLDDFAAKTDLPAGPCILKIDVENYEGPVLRGGKKFINERRPWMVCEILAGQQIDPLTRIRTNNNADVVAMITELGYAPFAATADGFFRLQPADFSRARQWKDFLLVPAEKIPGDVNFLTLENVGEFFSA